MELHSCIDIRHGSMPTLGRMRRAWLIKRQGGSPKKPITSSILKKLLSCLDKRDYDAQTIRATLCFAKFRLLRVSEYTYGPNGNAPKIGDIAIVPDMINAQYLVYRFSKSKTNQFGRRERIVCICTCPEPCAVHEVIDMLSFRGSIDAKDPLFWMKDGSSPSDDQVRHTIKNLCCACGLNPKKFASHQLRAGGVTDMLAAGVPESMIQELARWARLDSMVPYKKLDDESTAGVLMRSLRQ